MQTPYDAHPDMAHYAKLPPDRAGDIHACC